MRWRWSRGRLRSAINSDRHARPASSRRRFASHLAAPATAWWRYGSLESTASLWTPFRRPRTNSEANWRGAGRQCATDRPSGSRGGVSLAEWPERIVLVRCCDLTNPRPAQPQAKRDQDRIGNVVNWTAQAAGLRNPDRRNDRAERHPTCETVSPITARHFLSPLFSGFLAPCSLPFSVPGAGCSQACSIFERAFQIHDSLPSQHQRP